ncbi:S100 calcium binding protein U [Chanos chanos]|uniref:S100 calcium binding protein U n=1 Tax=Chanos chanos TaxID=29144 RepID=A0A6J2WKY1_CHACN|nr:uncharacterized protein LOC115825413 [Chanos chanos]
METAIKTVVGVYLKSARGKETLGDKDFKTLVQNNLKNIMTDTDSSDAVKQMREGLDSNNDGKVSFQEYMTLVGYLAQALSQQRSGAKETQAESSAAETQAETPAAVNSEPEAAAKEEEKEEKPAEEKPAEEKPATEEGEKSEEANKVTQEEGEEKAEAEEEKTEEAS